MKLASMVFVLILFIQPCRIAASPDPTASSNVARDLQRYYGQHLSAMNELPFGPQPEKRGDLGFRFTWLRTFHHPICIRIEHRGGATVIYSKEANGAGGYNPGSLIVERKSVMSQKSYQKLLRKLQQVDFFEQAADQNRSDVEDGAQWVFEANRGERYHIVDCLGGGSLRDLGLFLLREASLLPPESIY